VRRGIPRIGPLRRARAFVDYATGGIAALEGNDEIPSYYSSNGILGDRLRGRLVREETEHRAWSVTVARTVFEDHIARAQRTHFVGEYLSKVDGTTMHYGLEARSPFLDQRLWEFAASLPVELRLHGFHLKAILREIVRRRIGAVTASRRKRGFGIPVHRWLADGWHEAARSVWERSVLQEEGWVDASSVSRAFANARKNGVAPLPLWYLFILEMWLRHERSDAALSPETERIRQARSEIRSPRAVAADFSSPTSSAETNVGLAASTSKRN
jgi:asparagine synthase (glutamine-hydrolysing)